jgi:hypothetical protein
MAQPRSFSDWGSGVSGYGAAQPSTYGWRVGSDINDADYDEAIRQSYETLQNEDTPRTFNPDDMQPDQDEIRRRRLNRFNVS